MEIEQYVEPFRTTLDASGDVETALAEIRRLGASQLQSLFAVKTVLDLSIVDGDHIILNSPTWSDRYQEVVDLRDQVAGFMDRYRTRNG